MRKALKSARAGADFVIAALHDGLEYSDVPPSKHGRDFRFLAENGADLVVGHHPHVLQGLEWIGNVPVAYSLGNFLFHSSLPHVAQRSFKRIAMGLYAPDEILRDPNKFVRGALLTVKFSGNVNIDLLAPFRQGSDLRPRLCRGDAKVEDLNRLAELSAALSNKKDFRHALADSVVGKVRSANMKKIGIQELLRLALRPKWRYIPRGLNWLAQRMNFIRSVQ